MDKNFNLENAKSIIAEASGVPVNTTFGSITKPIDLLLEVIDMSADLIALIHEETELKKHHRAYLHVHEELEDCADEMAVRMQEIFDETTDCVIGPVSYTHLPSTPGRLLPRKRTTVSKSARLGKRSRRTGL